MRTWPRFDSLPRAYDWIRGDLKAGRVRAVDLVNTTCGTGIRAPSVASAQSSASSARGRAC